MEANTIETVTDGCDRTDCVHDATVSDALTSLDQHPHRFLCGHCLVGLCLTLLSFPALAIVALLVLVVDGRPVLYAGARLGKGKRQFSMYKFRTLSTDAHERIGAQLHTSSMGMETRLGKFLRNCRLDELPQLFNVINGEMAFVGPRPVRPEVYEAHCKSIPGYDRRFEVLPGVVGFSQLFTPHGTPKPVRSRIDNSLAARPCSQAQDIVLVALAGASVVRSISLQAVHFLRDLCTKLTRNHGDQRESRRITGIDATAMITCLENSFTVIAPVYDITSGAFSVTMPTEMEEGTCVDVRLKARIKKKRHGGRIRQARCRGTVQALRKMDDGNYTVVVIHEPLSTASDYFLRKYFLRESFSSVG